MAEAAYQKALEMLESLVWRHPDVDDFRRDLSAVWSNMAVHYAVRGMMDDSLAASADCIRLCRTLLEQHPNHEAYQRGLAQALSNHVEFALRVQQLDAARAAASESLQVREQMVAEQPGSRNHRADVAAAAVLRGRVETQADNHGPALEFYQQAEQILTELVDRNPNTPHYRQTLGHCESDMATLLAVLDTGQAEAYYERAFQTRKKLAEDFPDSTRYLLDLFASQSNLGSLPMEDRSTQDCGNAIRSSH